MSTPTSPSAAFEAPKNGANLHDDAHITSPEEKLASTSSRAESSEPIDDGAGNESTRSTPEPGLIDETTDQNVDTAVEETSAPPLPNEAPPLPQEAPPLPNEVPPGQMDTTVDDGWHAVWDASTNSWWFFNKYTHVWQQENPRVPSANSTDGVATTATAPVVVPTSAPLPYPTASAAVPPPDTDRAAISDLTSVAGGYNPAIHGSYDPNAWYAKNSRAVAAQEAAVTQAQNGYQYATAAYFNRTTGQYQMPEMGAERHSDDAKSRRQMNSYFDVDAAANQHDGRSLKAERSGKKPTKAELKAFKEKRKARKEEKRRAWLLD